MPPDPPGEERAQTPDALRRQVAELELRVRDLEGRVDTAAGNPGDPIENGSRFLAETVPSPLYVYSLTEERNIWANTAHRELFGQVFESGDRQHMLSFVHPDDVGPLIAALHRIEELADGERLQREYRVRFHDGDWHWFRELCAVYRRDEGGKVIEFLGSTTDITEHRLAEEALRESEARYRELAELLPETLFEIDAEARVTFLNQAALARWGYSQEDYERGISAFDMVVPEDRERLRTNIATRYLGAQGPRRYAALRKDGTTFPIAIWARPLFRDGAPAGLQGVVIDESERMQAEKAREESEARFRAVFENAAVGIALVDPDGRVIDANGYDCEVLGYSRDELVGMHFRDLTHPSDAGTDEALYGELMSGRRQSYSITKRYVRRDGEVRWGDLSVSVIADRDGRPLYTVAVMRDVTDRHRAERELERLLTEVRGLGDRLAEAQEEERRRLAHELHDRIGSRLTVLSLEIGYAQGILPTDADLAVAARLDDCLDLVEELGAMVRGVMTDLQPPELADYGLLAALRPYCERLSARTGLPIRVRGDDSGPRPAAAVEIAFFRIAQEALTNVATHAEASGAEVILERGDAGMEMTVVDDGRGFDRARVAARGQRGWGLTTMRERARSVGASFDCETARGRGCRVRVACTWESDGGPSPDRR